jgi:hypothetical protein
MNHIDLSLIENFPPSSLTPSVNLLWLDISYMGRLLDPLEEDGSLEIVVQSEQMPKIREFHSRDSSLLTMKLLHAKRQDGRPAFNFTDLRQLRMSLAEYDDERNIRYLLLNAKLLEKLHLSVKLGRSLVGLLSPSACTLKVLDLTVSLYDDSVPVPLPLAGLCEELEAMAGHNVLEALSLEVVVDDLRYESEDFIGPIIQDVEKELVKPGWSALRHVSFEVTIDDSMNCAELCEALQSLPDKYLSHLPNLESVTFNYSATPISRNLR